VDIYSASNIPDLCQLILDRKNLGQLSHDTRHPEFVDALSGQGSVTNGKVVLCGAACRFPGGISKIEDFWSALICPDRHAGSPSSQAPAHRWNASEVSTTVPMCWLDNEALDNVSSVADFFSIAPSEAEAMSPNARLVMQLGYEALQDAGIAPKSLSNRPWGIFTSLNESGWRERRVQDVGLSAYAATWASASDDVAGSRLAYFLNMKGPCVEIKTACSSSAVALHYAQSSIMNGDCEAALVISSTTHLSPAGPMFRREAGIASPSGKCATFSSDADGFLPSEGAVALVLQRMEDAKTPPYASIRASAIGQDGRSHGFTAPNVEAQARLLKEGLRRGKCHPNDISFFEAHGTGTPVGDAIEVAAINQVYGYSRERPLFLGAAKAAIGHTEECSGLTGIVKAILCFKHNAVPPQPHFLFPGKEIDLFPAKLVVPTSVEAFVREENPRLIALSSFGLSGTLSHVILEEPERIIPLSTSPKSSNIFLLSARTPAEYRALLERFLEWCITAEAQRTSLDDVCRTSQLGRDHFSFRSGWLVDTWKTFHSLILTALQNPIPARTLRNPSISLWFSLPHADATLPSIDTSVFWQTLEECHESGGTGQLEYFGRQLAIARTLAWSGCEIATVGGEGVGEYIAAAFAGIINIPTAFQILKAIAPVANQSVGAWMVHCPYDTLDGYLLDFAHHELHIRGRYDLQTSYVVGSPSALVDLSRNMDLHDIEPGSHFLTLRNETSLQNVHFVPDKANIPVVSGFLGEIAGQDLLMSISYWRGVNQHFVRAHEARVVLQAQSGLVLDLSVNRCDQLGASISFENGVDDVLTHLYNLGCHLDWSKLVSPGKMAHVPTYSWIQS